MAGHFLPNTQVVYIVLHCAGRRQVYLGGYDDEEAAAEAYDMAALKSKGAGCPTNFPPGQHTSQDRHGPPGQWARQCAHRLLLTV
jgi:hypothetical protein